MVGICSDTAVFKNKEVEEERRDYTYVSKPVRTRVKIRRAVGIWSLYIIL